MIFDGTLSGMPSWSPDGEWIVFNYQPTGGDYNIYRCRPDGSALTQLTFDTANDEFARWGTDPWRQTGKLVAFDDDPSPIEDWFGFGVSISGNRLVAGAAGDETAGSGAGSAYVFELVDGAWVPLGPPLYPGSPAELIPENGWFGWSVGIDGDVIVVGAPTDNENGSNAGAAYIFEWDEEPGVWLLVAKLLEPAPETPMDPIGSLFGYSVGVSGDTVVVGAADGGSGQGSAHVFQRTESTWTHVQALVPDPVPQERYGWAVAIEGDVAIVGAYGDDVVGNDSGSAYVFTRDDGGNWSQEWQLLPQDPTGQAEDEFGYSVACTSEYAVIGAYQDDDRRGSVYVFDIETGEQIRWWDAGPDATPNDEFAVSVAISGSIVIAGAHSDDGIADDQPNAGAAYLFDVGTGEMIASPLYQQDPATLDEFGRWVTIDGDTAIVGAYEKNNLTGAIYVFGGPAVLGDLDRDGIVNGSDLGILLGDWGPCDDCGECSGDLNLDAIIDGADLGLLLANWG